MTHRDSSYYPPRATAFSPIWTRFDACGRVLKKLAWRPPTDVTTLGMLGGLLVPGLAIYLRRPDRSGRAAMGACALLLLVFIVFLGFPLANIAFTILLSIHVIGLVAYCKPLFADFQWPSRLLSGFLLTVATICLVYLPLQHELETRLFTPLEFHGHVLVMNRLGSPNAVRRGDWIAFSVAGNRNYFQGGGAHGSVIVREGVNLAPVLGMPGDHIQFTGNAFLVNGVAQPHRLHMPTAGDLTVPGKCWFVWPEMGIGGYGNVPEGNVIDAILPMTVVHQDQFIGKAFHRWFGRRQSLS